MQEQLHERPGGTPEPDRDAIRVGASDAVAGSPKGHVAAADMLRIVQVQRIRSGRLPRCNQVSRRTSCLGGPITIWPVAHGYPECSPLRVVAKHQ